MQVCPNRLRRVFALYRVPYSVIQHAPAYSSQVAAATMHVPGKEMAKAVVLQGNGQSYLAVLPASHHVDLNRFSEIAGEPVTLASEEKIRELFPDCELGAIPPFGRLYGVPVYVDVSLALDREIIFPAGTHREAVRMSYQDFESLTRPEVCSFANKDGGRHRAAVRKRGREHL
jgi:Ala-tRNA(Pro) deacylase